MAYALQFLYNRTTHKIKIDYDNYIFQAFLFNEKEIDYLQDAKVPVNMISGTTTATLHYNGNKNSFCFKFFFSCLFLNFFKFGFKEKKKKQFLF